MKRQIRLTESELHRLVESTVRNILKEDLDSNYLDNSKLKKMREKGLLWDEIFDNVYDFREGYAPVELNNKWNFIDAAEGYLLSPHTWFDSVGEFNEGYASIRLDGKCNYIDKEGYLLSRKWFDAGASFHNGYAPVILDDKCNVIDTEGNILYGDPNDTNTWSDYFDVFYDNDGNIKI